MTNYNRCVVLAGGVLLGCGAANGRPDTAPELPIPYFDAPCSELDSFSDGSVNAMYSYTFDVDGFEIGLWSDSGQRGTFVYDADHFLLDYTEHVDGDPTLDYEEHYTRDPLGRILSGTTMYDGYTADIRNRYDDQGRAIEWTQTITMDGGSTTTTTDVTYTGDAFYPTSGTMTTPGFSSALTYTMSTDGRSQHVDIDDRIDGTIDRTEDRTFDANRRTLSVIKRTAGVVTSRISNTYNDRGEPLTSTSSRSELGMPDDLVWTDSYDNAGMLTQEIETSPSGAHPSRESTLTFKDTCVSPLKTARVNHQPHLPIMPFAENENAGVAAATPAHQLGTRQVR